MDSTGCFKVPYNQDMVFCAFCTLYLMIKEKDWTDEEFWKGRWEKTAGIFNPSATELSAVHSDNGIAHVYAGPSADQQFFIGEWNT